MTTQELHIELDLLLQKVDSNWSKNLLPQEKDWFLNNEIIKFIKQRTDEDSNRKGTGIFNTIKRTQDLNPLIKTIPIDVQYNQGETVAQLPFNFLGYIASYGNICCNCEEEQVQKSNYTTSFLPIIDISLINDTNNSYSIKVSIQGVEYTIFDLDDLPSDYLNQEDISSYKKRFILINAILNTFSKSDIDNIELTYDNKSGKFIIRTKQPHITKISINGLVTNLSSQSNIYNTYNLDKKLKCDIRIVDEEFKNDINISYLSRSKNQSIVGYLRQKEIILEIPFSAIINRLYLTYICYPQRIDLLLDSNSEFGDSTLKEIVAKATQTIKGVISTDTYNKYVQENMLIE